MIESGDQDGAALFRNSVAGANGGVELPFLFREPDPKSGASANSATFARDGFQN